ncbi:hypothetical protein ACFC1R_23715 [Kitasatospora sp. NPDC056138]|uniref:hypothetical protein n=1 Tax=Kitasatospora sp. NPDC056138 TaxID=3345724 RepID=UPI0035D836FB
MLLLWLGVFGGYGLGAVVTARAVFERGRSGYLASAAPGRGNERAVGEFEQQERQHIEVIALFCGLLWVTAVPALLLRHIVARLALARPCAGRNAEAVRERIDELERSLGLGAYADSGCRAARR